MEHLAKLLLDFGSAPGNYLVRLREPRVLFDEFDVIAVGTRPLARVFAGQGHRSEGGGGAVYSACLFCAGQHYQVLGLRHQAYPSDELRARYRTMIRLAHPDMGVKGLPAQCGQPGQPCQLGISVP